MSKRDKKKSPVTIVKSDGTVTDAKGRPITNRRNGKARKRHPKTPRRTGRTVNGRTPEGHKRHEENREIYEQKLALRQEAEKQRKLREKAGVPVEAGSK